jgi:chaperonin GroES
MKPKANFVLLHDLVMLYPIAKTTKTASGLIIPAIVEKNDTAPIEGIVLAVGPGKADKKGEIVPLPVKAGDRVVFVKNAARVVTHDGESFLVVPISEILCKIGHEAA